MLTGSKFESHFRGSGQMVDLKDSTITGVTIQTTSTQLHSITPSHIVSTFDRDILEATTSTTELFAECSPVDCVRVETRNSRSLVMSVDSKLLVSAPEPGELVEVAPLEAVGMLVPISMGNSFVSNEYSRDLGWLYGVMVADGWISKNTLGYSKDDGLKRVRFEELAAKLLSPEFRSYEYHDDGESEDKFAPSTKVHLNGSKLVQEVEEIYHPDERFRKKGLRGALFKMIPPTLLMNSSQECLWGLLSGLIDGDSSLVWNMATGKPRFYLRFNTSSPYLRDDIVFLLRKLGMRSSVTTTPARNRSQESYVVIPSVVDFRKAVQHVQCVGSEENQVLSEFSAEYHGRPDHDHLDVIPCPSAIAMQLRLAVGTKNSNLYSTVSKSVQSGRITRDAIIARLPNDVLERSEAARKLHRVASNPKLLWDEVVSVTRIDKQTLYKIQVAGGLPLVLWDGLIVPSYLPEVDTPAQPN